MRGDRRKYTALAQWRNNSPGDTIRDSIHLHLHMSRRPVCEFFLRASSITLSLWVQLAIVTARSNLRLFYEAVHY